MAILNSDKFMTCQLYEYSEFIMQMKNKDHVKHKDLTVGCLLFLEHEKLARGMYRTVYCKGASHWNDSEMSYGMGTAQCLL